MDPELVIVPPVNGELAVIEVTVPLLSALIVTVVPETEVVIPVPPLNVKVPEVVIAVPEPESAPAVIEVTVPEPPLPPVAILAVVPVIVKVPSETSNLVMGLPVVDPPSSTSETVSGGLIGPDILDHLMGLLSKSRASSLLLSR